MTPDLFLPLIKLLQIAIMISGSVRGAGKPINIVAFKAPPMIGSAPADLMMSSAAQSPLAYRTNTRMQPISPLIDLRLTEESIPDG